MKKAIISGFALLMLLLGSTVNPAEARWHHGCCGWGGGWGGYRGFGPGLGYGGLGFNSGLGLTGVGLGLGAVGSPYYGAYPYTGSFGAPVSAYTGYDLYNPGYRGGYNLYSTMPAGYYGMYGDYWY